ncbi:hypothetical protein ACFVUS_16750 [Nocardia sp. NPDC058058]|uniref:hypothetical protein n=1 Tax=Nocardia sp. NPDC058058 TaxID=3346317 RepID=UPI0036DC567E
MATDNTQWSNLRSSGGVKFDDSAVTDIVNACNALLGKFIGLQQFTDQLSGLKPFAGPSDKFFSGTRLAEEFSLKGTAVADAIKEHIVILDDIIYTYKAAGKAYAGAETDSVKRFEGIQRPDAASFASAPPDQKNAKVPPFTQKEPSNVQATGEHVINAETPASKKWEELYMLRESIDSPSVAHVGEMWIWMAGELSNAIPDFTNRIISTNDKWDGWAAARAKSATVAYSDSIGKFATGLKSIGNQLVTVSGWLAETKKNMPPQPNNPAGQMVYGGVHLNLTYSYQEFSIQTDNTAMYQENFRKTYVAGIADLNGVMLSVLSPNTPVGSPVTDQPQSPSGAPKTSAGVPTSPTGNPGVQTPENPQDNPVKDNPDKTTPDKTTTTDTTVQTIATTVQKLAETASSVATSGISALQTVGQQIATAIQSQVKTTDTTTTPTDTQKLLNQQLTNLQSLMNPSGSPTGGSPSSPGGGSPGTVKTQEPNKLVSKQFPRATIATEESVVTRAGVAAGSTASTGTAASSGTGGMGSPGASGAAQGQGKEYKRAAYLTGADNLDEVLEIPDAVRPVAEK